MLKGLIERILKRVFSGPPGPPGSIEYIRWQAAKEWEEEEDAS